MAPERKVPILKTDNCILDQEFNSIRERFEAEMRKMEDEMNKFRHQLVDREKEVFSPASSTTTTTTTQKTTKTHSSSTSSDGSTTHKSELRTWLDGLNSPLIHDGDDGKMLKLRFDVSQYAPEEIVVKTVDNRLQVHAKHEEKSENRSVYREYNREFLMPKDTNPELIRSSLSKDGVLTVEAPLPGMLEANRERMIPIDKSH